MTDASDLVEFALQCRAQLMTCNADKKSISKIFADSKNENDPADSF